MAVVNDYKCPKHGYFESRKPQCPMKDCYEEVMVVFLQAPSAGLAQKPSSQTSLQSNSQWSSDMSDIKTTREGEHQTGFLTRNNKFTEKEYAQAQKSTQPAKKRVNKDKIVPPSPPVQKKLDQEMQQSGVEVCKE
jgi:hypothetical protein